MVRSVSVMIEDYWVLFFRTVTDRRLTKMNGCFRFLPIQYHSGHPPEAEFLEKIKAIPGVSLVETQTITNMII